MRYIDNVVVFSGQAISAGQSATSAAIVANRGFDAPEGYFSYQMTVAGDGTAKAEVLISGDNVNFMEADGASDVMAGKTAGTSIASFSIPACKAFKIKVTETGSSNAITVSGIVCVVR